MQTQKYYEKTPVPLARQLLDTGELHSRIHTLQALQSSCTICPRQCRVNRESNELGICQAPAQLFVSSIFSHFGEEPELVGSLGSGTIFLSHCNLRCVFCQNFEISHLGTGNKISIEEMAEWMLHLQELGCHNINFVTPSHYVIPLVMAIEHALNQGLHLPLVYNCSGYEAVATLQLLAGIIDIYMPDFKFATAASGSRYAAAPDYFSIACAALQEMHQQVGDLVVATNGIAQRGLLIRHLVLPGLFQESKIILAFIAQEISRDSYVNIMAQYRPCGLSQQYPELNRRVSSSEIFEVKSYAKHLGLHRGF